MVNYQTKDNAISKGLAYVQSDGTTVMTVDPNSTLSSGEYRDSVRVSSKNTYSNGLIIADIWAMPHGCSVWPAYWMVGPSWPSDGEIDILEGVNGEFSFILSLLPRFSLLSPYNFFCFAFPTPVLAVLRCWMLDIKSYARKLKQILGAQRSYGFLAPGCHTMQ